MNAEQQTVTVPYRICPLGAHVDHQGGPVLGMTIDVASVLTYTARADNQLLVSSTNFAGEGACVLDQIPAMRPGAWANYAFGAAWVLRERYAVRHGLTGVIRGTLPGCGLSSSASVTLAYLHALAQVNALSLDRWEYVQLVQRVENGYLGLQNGILDQTTIEFGTANALVQIDPRQRTAVVLAAPARATPYRILIAFSGFTRALTASGYNTRVQECQTAARLLGERCGQPAARILSDIPAAMFAVHAHALPDHLRRRARHYFEEVARVQEGIAAWQAGDMTQFGRLMLASCASSINNYECGSAPVQALQQIVAATPGCLGARFSGGGFRGCVVRFFAAQQADAACARILNDYCAVHPEMRAHARVFLVASADGVRCA